MEAKSRLWNHQIESIKFALGHKSTGIFSGMGSGKTRIAIEVVKAERSRTVLVVVPKNVLIDGVWGRQLEQFFDAPYSHVSLRLGSTAVKAKLLKDTLLNGTKGVTTFVVVNYDSAWREPLGSLIMNAQWDVVILDEAHRIKAAGSKISRFMGRLGSKLTVKKKMALTGTPAPNSPLDVYGLFRFLEPTIFGTNYANFAGQYAVFGGFNNYQVLRFKNLLELRMKMAAVSIRFETKDVVDLPEVMDIVQTCNLNSEAMDVYRNLEKEFVTYIEDQHMVAATVLVKTIRLRQITGGFATMDTGDVIEISKDKQLLLADVLDSLPTQIVDDGIKHEPVIVFCQFRAEIKAIHKVLAAQGYTVGEVSGTANNLRAWHEEKCDALVIQTSAGAEGIDLTRAAYAIYYSLSWDLGEYDQSRARLHRPGQTRPTRFIHLIADNTIDNTVVKALRQKINVSNYVMEVYKHGHSR